MSGCTGKVDWRVIIILPSSNFDHSDLLIQQHANLAGYTLNFMSFYSLKTYSCDACDYKSRSLAQLKNHKSSQHKTETSAGGEAGLSDANARHVKCNTECATNGMVAQNKCLLMACYVFAVAVDLYDQAVLSPPAY